MLSTFLIGDREISGNLKLLKEDLSSMIMHKEFGAEINTIRFEF